MFLIEGIGESCGGVAQVLNKFMENNFEKLERLLEMHEELGKVWPRADRELRGIFGSVDPPKPMANRCRSCLGFFCLFFAGTLGGWYCPLQALSSPQFDL